jgi:hypothetical protein
MNTLFVEFKIVYFKQQRLLAPFSKVLSAWGIKTVINIKK